MPFSLRSTLALAMLLVACRDGASTTSNGGAGGVGASSGGHAGEGGTGGATGGGGSAEGGAPDPEDIRLLAWNIETFPKSPSTIEKVVSVIEDLKPDLVGMEELDAGADFQNLDGALEDYEGLLAMSGDGYSRVGLMYRPDRLTISDAEMLFADDSYAFPRPVLAVHVTRVDDPSQDFLFGVVHLKAELDTESTARRRDACQKLDLWIRNQLETGVESEIVLAGDFNDNLTDPPQYNVFGPLLDAPDGGFLTLGPEQSGDFTYIPFESFIDHVHVRGPALSTASSASVVHLEETVSDYVSTVSDHRPVLAKLRFSSR